VLGPVLVNYIREYQLDHGVARADAYSITMYILAGLLVVGFFCNWRVRPVDPKHHMTAVELAADGTSETSIENESGAHHEGANNPWLIVAAWLAVWIPITWGIWITLSKAIVMFR
jgi:hypothetical protein